MNNWYWIILFTYTLRYSLMGLIPELVHTFTYRNLNFNLLWIIDPCGCLPLVWFGSLLGFVVWILIIIYGCWTILNLFSLLFSPLFSRWFLDQKSFNFRIFLYFSGTSHAKILPFLGLHFEANSYFFRPKTPSTWFWKISFHCHHLWSDFAFFSHFFKVLS